MQKRAPYIKHNSLTQKACRESKQTILEITELLQISRDDWILSMFENGCIAVENGIQNPAFGKRLLEDISLGFWAWWLQSYIDDDAELLNMNKDYVKMKYQDLKKATALKLEFQYHDFETDKSYRL